MPFHSELTQGINLVRERLSKVLNPPPSMSTIPARQSGLHGEDPTAERFLSSISQQPTASPARYRLSQLVGQLWPINVTTNPKALQDVDEHWRTKQRLGLFNPWDKKIGVSAGLQPGSEEESDVSVLSHELGHALDLLGTDLVPIKDLIALERKREDFFDPKKGTSPAYDKERFAHFLSRNYLSEFLPAERSYYAEREKLLRKAAIEELFRRAR